MEISEKSLIELYSQKQPDELVALHQSGNLTETAYSAIESVMKKSNIDIPERPEPYSNIQTEDSLKQYWKGSKSLKSAFWVISMAGSLVVIFFAFVAAKLGQAPYSKLAIYSAITNPYFIFVVVVLWRCAKGKSKWLLKFIGLLTITIVVTLPFFMYGFMALNR
ncbi:hypothetical protein [Marinobacter gelidimuriae]|uniref:hypothetical protein n=1 Tax=Marinobacter gelidimuriae TaxID=2739064 RepID=UPI000375603E|nr:hypothetical protein [Marinobacter gelidimuriae]